MADLESELSRRMSQSLVTRLYVVFVVSTPYYHLTRAFPCKQYENLLVHVVDQVIMPPMNITSTLGAANLTALVGALNMVSPDLAMGLSMTPRLTIFGGYTPVLAKNIHRIQLISRLLFYVQPPLTPPLPIFQALSRP